MPHPTEVLSFSASENKNDNNFSFLTPLYVKYDNLKMLSETDKTIHIFYNS